jgi:sugar transferase (PEP-CTERM system associated)
MIRLGGRYNSIGKVIFVLGEGILIFCAVALAFFSLVTEEVKPAAVLKDVWLKVLLIVVVTQACLYFNDLYEEYLNNSYIDLVTGIIQSIGITSIILAIIYFLWPSTIIGRWIFLGSIIFLIGFIISWRFFYGIVIQKRYFTERAMVIGDGELAGDLLKATAGKRESGCDICLVVCQGNDNNPLFPNKEIPVKHGFDTICDLAKDEHISRVIVALDQRRGVMPYKELLKCKMSGIGIIDGEGFYEGLTGKILVEKINPSWLIFSDGFVKSPSARVVKRFVGLTLSVIMATFLSPLLVLIAAAIKIDSPGPVIFSQQRVGENCETFTLYKFRSMRADAERKCGPVWASEDDPRITKVGKIIRKLRIDEVPQLWNVIKGDMSFVGPRPERPYFVEKLKKTIPYYSERFSVKPGITGWAQIKYPYGASDEDALEKLKYDLYYIKNMSLIMDLIVIFHTVKIVLLGRGSR